MSVVNCLRRPSSKARTSLKSYTLTHNLVSIEEEQVIGGKKHNDKGG
jgi:hypothetical protein